MDLKEELKKIKINFFKSFKKNMIKFYIEYLYIIVLIIINYITIQDKNFNIFCVFGIIILFSEIYIKLIKNLLKLLEKTKK